MTSSKNETETEHKMMYQYETREQRAAARAERMAKADKARHDKFVIRVFCVATVILMFGCVFAKCGIENAQVEYIKDLPRVEYVVKSGDTIDGIAAAHQVGGISDHYLGYIISDINGVSGCLHPGDVLELPSRA